MRAWLLCVAVLSMSILVGSASLRAQDSSDFSDFDSDQLDKFERGDIDNIERGDIEDQISPENGQTGRTGLEPIKELQLLLELQRLANKRESTALEEDFSARAGVDLQQFGYELFQTFLEKPVSVGGGAVQDDYILGIGDELVVTFRGQVSTSGRSEIDREGRVVLKDLPPISAAGRSFGDFRRELEARTQMTLLGSEVFVSLGKIRLVSVLVVGEVERPGIHRISALSSLLDAISLAGGIKKTGSLRQLQIVRGDNVFWLDLYELIVTGSLSRDLLIRDGDRIVVPTIGDTVAVAGWVKRPGIYELGEGTNGNTLADLIAFGGGTVRSKGYRLLHISMQEDGRQRVDERTNPGATRIAAGDILLVEFSQDIQIGSVKTVGNVRVPNRRSLISAPTLRALLADGSILDENPYLLFAAVETTDTRTRTKRLYPANLESVFAGEVDYRLHDQDVVLIFSAKDIEFLRSAEVQRVLTRNTDDEEALPCLSLRVLESAMVLGDPRKYVGATLYVDLPLNVDVENLCPALFEEYPKALLFLLEHAVMLQGEVRAPGVYPITGGTALASIVSVAEGLSREANLSYVELTRYDRTGSAGKSLVDRQVQDLSQIGMAAVLLDPGDAVQIGKVFSDRDLGHVTVLGEFNRPGRYTIKRGERISEIIARAGGLTPQAYPYGAVFTRVSIKLREKLGNERAAIELEGSLASALSSEDSGKRSLGSASQAVSQLANTLRTAEPVGRLVMEADPTVLQIRPDLDIVMEPGDQLILPKRPSSVTVAGEVLNPGALQYLPGLKADKYIEMAGGIGQNADEGRIFVIFPNGAAKPLSISYWNYDPVNIPPGSTVVVPLDAAPFEFVSFVKDITQILSQVAISAASLAVISGN